MSFSIASYNANSIRMRLDAVLAWLDSHKPSVLAIQETKAADSSFPRKEIEDTGWHVSFHGQKSYNGVCLISKEPANDVVMGLSDGVKDPQARLIAARYDDIHVINVYIPQGSQVGSDKFAYKLEWYQRLHRFLEARYTSDQKVILLGDFNVAPLDIDVYAPDFFEDEVGMHPDERAALQNIVDWGFDDLFRHFHPDTKKQFTFFDYRTRDSVKYRKGWRIDHILTTTSLTTSATSCAIDMEPRLLDKASDHTYITAHFDV